MSTPQPWTYDDAARMAHTLGKSGPLSAAERARQRDAYIAAVDGMATMLKAAANQVDSLTVSRTDIWRRFNAIEQQAKDAEALALDRYNELHHRLMALKADYDGHIAWHVQQRAESSFLARLRWLLTGR